MILAADVHYYEKGKAKAAGILFRDWHSDRIERSIIKETENIAPYEPGQFYKRELPCLLELLEEIKNNVDIIIVDGYVTLGTDKKPGLGVKCNDLLKAILGY